ncbi:MAG: hypothetical protein JW889_03080 [Verrucomicrobia bacterium]|nr:hypothetical protein [Verrucomicrobiota bacterium]
MRDRAARAIAIVFAWAVCGSVWAQGVFELERIKPADSQNALMQMAGRRVHAAAADSSGLVDLPSSVSDRVAQLTVLVAGREAPFLVDFGEEATRLFADTNADGRLADEQPIALQTMDRTAGRVARSSGAAVETHAIAYRTLTIRAPGRSRGAMVTLGVDGWVQGRTQVFLSFYPGALMSGVVTLNGTAQTVALIDKNLDGRYDGFMKGPAAGLRLDCDAMGIDLDGNGHYGASRTGAEIFELGRLLRLGDEYYDIRPARDGATLTLKRAAPKMGTLDVGCPDLELTLQSAMGTAVLSSNGGTWRLPVGTYEIRGFALRLTGPDGVAWAVQGNGTQGGALSRFEIRRGRTTRITAGPPLTLAAQTTARGDAISINVDIVGRAGEHYRADVSRDGMTQPAPAFVVIDNSGAELVSGAFAYG